MATKSTPNQHAEDVVSTIDVTITYHASVTFDGSRAAALRAYREMLKSSIFENSEGRREFDASEYGIEYNAKVAAAVARSDRALREIAVNEAMLDLGDRIESGRCKPAYDGNTDSFDKPHVRTDVAAHLDAPEKLRFLHEPYANADVPVSSVYGLVRSTHGTVSADVRITRCGRPQHGTARHNPDRPHA